jgi:ferredoxin
MVEKSIGRCGKKMSKLSSSRAKTYALSSFEVNKPGLVELLFKRSFTVGMADYLFHIGLYGSIITGALMEISNLVPGFADFFNGVGWLISWSHGATGVFIVVGGVGFVLRYFKKGSFRLATGRTFYVDFPFLLIIGVTGMLQALAVFGLMPVVGFTSSSLEWVASIHVTMIYTWILASLFLGGAVRHGLAVLMWRFTDPEKKHAQFLTFSDACGRCGRCVEFCSLYEATKGAGVAPVLKVRRYFKMIAAGSLTESEVKSIAEQTAACTMCGLCVAVCPFSFNFVDLYKELLAYASKVIPVPSVGGHTTPQIS